MITTLECKRALCFPLLTSNVKGSLEGLTDLPPTEHNKSGAENSNGAKANEDKDRASKARHAGAGLAVRAKILLSLGIIPLSEHDSVEKDAGKHTGARNKVVMLSNVAAEDLTNAESKASEERAHSDTADEINNGEGADGAEGEKNGAKEHCGGGQGENSDDRGVPSVEDGVKVRGNVTIASADEAGSNLGAILELLFAEKGILTTGVCLKEANREAADGAADAGEGDNEGVEGLVVHTTIGGGEDLGEVLNKNGVGAEHSETRNPEAPNNGLEDVGAETSLDGGDDGGVNGLGEGDGGAVGGDGGALGEEGRRTALLTLVGILVSVGLLGLALGDEVLAGGVGGLILLALVSG